MVTRSRPCRNIISHEPSPVLSGLPAATGGKPAWRGSAQRAARAFARAICLLPAPLGLTGCRTPAVPAVRAVFPSPDILASTSAEAGYQILLEGRPCATFILPELIGQGRPRVEIASVGGGWQHVGCKD